MRTTLMVGIPSELECGLAVLSGKEKELELIFLYHGVVGDVNQAICLRE
jgi:hypothetical protein